MEKWLEAAGRGLNLNNYMKPGLYRKMRKSLGYGRNRFSASHLLEEFAGLCKVQITMACALLGCGDGNLEDI